MADAGAEQTAAVEQVAAVPGRTGRAAALQQDSFAPAGEAGDILNITSTSEDDDVDKPLVQRLQKRPSGTQPAAKRSRAKRTRTASLQALHGVTKATLPCGSRGPALSDRKGSHSGGSGNGSASRGGPRKQNSGSAKPGPSNKPRWDAYTPIPKQTAGADRRL